MARVDYELGLRRLQSALLRKSPQLPPEFKVLEVRLIRILDEIRIYGDDPTGRVEWAKIMSGLIRLAHEQVGLDFNELCRSNQSPDTPLTFPADGDVFRRRKEGGR